MLPLGLNVRRYCPADRRDVGHLLQVARAHDRRGGGSGDEDRTIAPSYLTAGGECLVGQLTCHLIPGRRPIASGPVVVLAAFRLGAAGEARDVLLEVHPAHRTQGHGSALLAALEEAARVRGSARMEMVVPAAVAGFPRRHGYCEVEAADAAGALLRFVKELG